MHLRYCKPRTSKAARGRRTAKPDWPSITIIIINAGGTAGIITTIITTTTTTIKIGRPLG
jgi:hypothetical protein